jgi:hypothetical protein
MPQGDSGRVCGDVSALTDVERLSDPTVALFFLCEFYKCDTVEALHAQICDSSKRVMPGHVLDHPTRIYLTLSKAQRREICERVIAHYAARSLAM